ncbi:minor capsid protein [Sporosarcina saromensis]|uniref:Minor capsid protein n=1 Tax=Sporosarcina saromensis TaxID=359365 RepID=A0ABU4G9V1_9BACL|nr:minor capsid protein [Sporosarcina saromensis]MDW0113764.1 minor capsid protein [Sporosarcina saromensis]
MSGREFIAYLTSLGFNVFPDPDHMPDVPESQLPALFVFGTGGFGSDPDLPIQYPSFQVIVKGKSYKTDYMQMELTEALAKSLIDALDQKTGYVIDSNKVYYSRSQSSNPIPIGLDIHDRPTYSTNFNFKIQPALKGAY